jgi:hypothetical protein
VVEDDQRAYCENLLLLREVRAQVNRAQCHRLTCWANERCAPKTIGVRPDHLIATKHRLVPSLILATISCS